MNGCLRPIFLGIDRPNPAICRVFFRLTPAFRSYIMDQMLSSPVPRHARRMALPCHNHPARKVAVLQTDPRWSLLDLVRRARTCLGLRDRDIAVLRGLLSLIPASGEAGALVVFASNRVLIERCDGIDERTLRRRLEHLRSRGLVARKSSPNGKRYQVRDDQAEVRLAYGIDLTPLFLQRDHLAALAEQCARDEIRCKALRSVIRDILYHHATDLPPEPAQQAARSLRRSLSPAQLEALITCLRAELAPETAPDAPQAKDLSASDSQNDRHIQSSDKEYFDSDTGIEIHASALTVAPLPLQPDAQKDITIGECLDLAKNATAFAADRPRDWPDILRLSATLGPALGLQPGDIGVARQAMGPFGCALAILGLVEAFDTIRNPRAYLRSLATRACDGGLDVVRMFRSLTRPRVAGVGADWAA